MDVMGVRRRTGSSVTVWGSQLAWCFRRELPSNVGERVFPVAAATVELSRVGVHCAQNSQIATSWRQFRRV